MRVALITSDALPLLHEDDRLLILFLAHHPLAPERFARAIQRRLLDQRPWR